MKSLKTKKILNMGLAFDEERICKKFSKLAKEGWLLKSMSIFSYKLEKGEPRDTLYNGL